MLETIFSAELLTVLAIESPIIILALLHDWLSTQSHKRTLESLDKHAETIRDMATSQTHALRSATVQAPDIAEIANIGFSPPTD